MSEFGGFPTATRTFLEGIAATNTKAWFEEHRELYQEGYAEAGRAFVEAIGPDLRKISPEVRFEPRINGSISRINRDIRFSKDKRPYKDHLDLWFWHGENKGWDFPGFFVRLTPKVIWLGAGMHALHGDMLTRFRDAVVDERSGKSLLAAIGKVEAAGPYVVGGKTRKQVPRGYDKGGSRADYLLYEALYAHNESPATAAYASDFGKVALVHFKNTWPIAKWLLDEVVA